MPRASLITVGLILGVGASEAASFSIYGTSPDSALDSSSTCTAPILIAGPAGVSIKAHVRWSGPASGEDSLAAQSQGTAFTFTRNVPRGTFTIFLWWSFTDNNLPGCQSSYVFAAGGPPWKRPASVR